MPSQDQTSALAAVIHAYERKITAQETKKISLPVKVRDAGKMKCAFREMSELFRGFLSSPVKSGTMAATMSTRHPFAHQRCLLQYDRETGLRPRRFIIMFPICWKGQTCPRNKLAVPTWSYANSLVPRRGLEPPRLATHGPEPCASTNSATWAI